ncbi:MAG: sulfurtransferase TusA family protein [bacterium]
MTGAPSSGEGPWAAWPTDWSFDSRFDGGDIGCGEMILDLRLHFRPLAAGTRVAISARDAGAPVEIPAWCRITGHVLLHSQHPYYLVAVRPDRREES